MMCNIGIEMKFVVLLLLGVFVWGDEEVRCIEREREALVSFKNGLTDESGILFSWRGDECCNWYGVVCSNTTDGHVIKLELGGAERNDFDTGLVGNVSSSLLELHHLNYLDLRGNDFGGNPIPEFIYSMKQLQHLYLKDSNFYGVVPPQIGNLTNLRSLDLSYNSLSCANLDWLSSLSLLSYLDLSSFDLSHTNWLQHILPLHSLHELHLKSCFMQDVKPSARIFLNSSSSSLSSLDLSDNHLTPSAFDWLSNVSSSLVKIDLSRNALGGLIPNAFERLTHLEHLDLASNMLEGEIPKSLGNLLGLIDFSSNRLTGNIPESLASMKGLRSLNLSRNCLTRNIISDIGQMETLESLDLSKNQLSGEIPTSLAQVHYLAFLDLSNNNLSGRIPSGTQLQSFNSSSYAGNNGLCGNPLTLCPEDIPRPPVTAKEKKTNEGDDGFWRLSFMQEFGISMGFGFIFGFWGVVGSFILKRSWRIAFFNLLDAAGDWFYVKAAIFLSKLRPT